MPDSTTAGHRAVDVRIAAAPISWGVCEVPGWGHQLPAELVLAEMRELGLSATEFGPVGFLADDPAAKARQLASFDLSAVGGFVPVLLHDPGHDPVPEVDAYIDGWLASGAGVVVLAAVTGADGYDHRPVLDELGWSTLLGNLDRLTDRAERRGFVASLHPHVGTMVENADEVDRVMAGSRVGLCVDTGHLAVCGADPVAIAKTYADRVNHVHAKDVDVALAARVINGDITFTDAVREGIFRPLGEGDVDIAGLVTALESVGYQGWYVLEQDVMLDRAPADNGPKSNVRKSLSYLLGAAG